MNILLSVFTLLLATTLSLYTTQAKAASHTSLVIQEQGSFAVGGTIKQQSGVFDPKKPFNPSGQTLHGDHAYVSYQKPEHAKKYPLVFLHGAGQFSKTWETTADGREGFQTIFLRRGFSTYLVDQPRRGGAGRSTVEETIKATPDEQLWFTQFRIGVWPEYFPGTQFPKGEETLNQFFRQMTPNTGAFDSNVISDALKALFDTIGQGILVTHSQGGGPGWETAMKSKNIRAIVAYEPGSGFIFPEGEAPAPIENNFATLKPIIVTAKEFESLTRMPIVIYYGDNIPSKPDEIPAKDYWRACLQMAHQFADVVNAHGGDVTVVHLPELGIKGNTHFLFSDINNIEVANLLSAWLKEKQLDK